MFSFGGVTLSPIVGVHLFKPQTYPTPSISPSVITLPTNCWTKIRYQEPAPEMLKTGMVTRQWKPVPKLFSARTTQFNEQILHFKGRNATVSSLSYDHHHYQINLKKVLGAQSSGNSAVLHVLTNGPCEIQSYDFSKTSQVLSCQMNLIPKLVKFWQRDSFHPAPSMLVMPAINRILVYEPHFAGMAKVMVNMAVTILKLLAVCLVIDPNNEDAIPLSIPLDAREKVDR